MIVPTLRVGMLHRTLRVRKQRAQSVQDLHAHAECGHDRPIGATQLFDEAPMFDYSARPELLKDRVILVTGAGRGIGAAAARTYAAHGATVLLLGKTEANLTALYDELEAAGYPQPVVIPFNLETALPHQYDELAAMIEAEFGRLDGLLHNASIIGPRTPIEQLSGEHFMRVMHINVNATFMLTTALLPLLKLSQDACVVFTSSSVGARVVRTGALTGCPNSPPKA
jgi:NAD(P)-dependent dehydrogenase (short-subunit alcohol dehydrogenase family)